MGKLSCLIIMPRPGKIISRVQSIGLFPPKLGFNEAPENSQPGRYTQGQFQHLVFGQQKAGVKVLVDAPVARYFKRKWMHPSQEIKKGRPDGTLVVTFRVGQYEGIRNTLKALIPHIVVLAPQKFKMDLLDDVKRWVRRQEELGDRA